MPRFIPFSKFRLVATSIICLISLAALVWPAASMWTSYGQNRAGSTPWFIKAAQNASARARRPDLLTKLIEANKQPSANKSTGAGVTLLQSPMQETANLLVPTITATKVDSLFTDVDGDGRVDPGDTIQYTLTINNAGTDATNVIVTDQIDSNTTLVGGSINTSPIAFDDTGYSATGNVRISISAASGVLVNDIDPDTGTNAGLTVSAGATSANGGNVALAADGSFSYNPPAGFTGTDTFTYTVTDASGATGTGTVTFNVSGMIWFIQTGAAAGGNGRLTNPFNCLVGAGCFDAVAADDPGDNIFLYSGAYTGGFTLLANQRLIGQGAGASLSTITGLTPPTGSDALPSTGGARPSITTTAAATSAITVGSGNTLRGFNIGDTTAVDITGTSFGTLTISEMTLSGTGRLLNLTTGTLAATIDSLQATTAPGGAGVSLTGVGGTLTVSGTTSITTAGGQGITISGSSVAANFGTSTTITDPLTQGILVGTSTGNISFGNTTVSDATDSVSLTNNSAGTRSFGTLTTTNGTGIGFLHSTGGGTVTVSGATTITNPGGRGIDIQNSTTSISFAATNVTGSGGTGVNLQSNSGSVTFGDLDISPDAAQRGLHALSNTGTLTTTSGVITTSTTGTPIEIVGVSAANRTPVTMVFDSVTANGAPNGIVLTSTSGTFAVNGTGTTAGSGGTIQNITNRGASFIDANGITLKNMNLTNVGTTNGADPTVASSTCGGLENGLGGNLGCNAGIHIVNVIGATFDRVVLNGGVQQGINGNNVTSFSLTNSSVLNFGDQTREDGIRIKNLVGTAAQPSVITSTTITGNEESQMRVLNTTGTLTTFNVTGSTFSNNVVGNGSDGLQFQGTGTAVMNINVQSSTISNNVADGFFSSGTDTSTVNVTVSGCTLQNNGDGAVDVSVVSGASGRFTITNNPTITGHVGNSINVNLGLPSTGTLQGTVSGNTITGSTSAAAGGAGVRVASNGSGNLHILIANNSITNGGSSQGAGIDMIARDGSNDLNATVTGNTVVLSASNPNNGIFMQSAALDTDTPQVCVDIGGSTAALRNSVTAPNAGGNAIRVRQRFGSDMRIPGYPGPANDSTQVATYIQGRNTIVSGLVTAATQAPGSLHGGAACVQPARFVEEILADDPSLRATMTASVLDQTEQPMAIDTASHTNATDSSAETNAGFANHITAIVTRQGNLLIDRQHAAQDESLRKGRASESDSQVPAHAEQEGKNPQERRPASDESESLTIKQDKDASTDSGETVTVGAPTGFTLPAGKTITVRFRATVNTGVLPAFTQVSNQGSVAGTGFTTVLTDDPDVAGANQPTVTLIDHTTVTVASNATPAVFGQNVTFTATMTGVPSRASDPPGTVQFKADGNNIGSPVAVVVGTLNDNVSTAQVSTASLSVGSHVITAEYSGGGSGATRYNANNGTLAPNQVVGKANTTTGVTSSQNPSVFGQQVTFTATIAPTAPGTGTPSGTVNFLDGGNPITGCTGVALAAGQATCQTSTLVVGNHTISVSYDGDTNFNTSSGNMTGNPQVVNKAAVNVGLTSATNPSVFGQAVSFTATLAAAPPGGGTPSGTVSFLDGGNPIAGCTNVAVVAGQAVCMTSALVVGNHTITAQYGGDANFNTNTGSLTGNPQVVNKATTSVGLTSGTNPSVFGQSVNFTATIGVSAPGAGSPTGTVQFLDGGNPITGCTSVALAAGQAVCSSSALAVGNHTITAQYSGDGNFNTSNGSLTGNPQVVNKADATVGLTSATNPSVFGQSVTFTATIAAAPPGAGSPTGTVNFLDSGNPIAACQNVALAAGQAQCITSALAVGNHTISAAYSGDGNFNTVSGNLTGNPQVVNKANTAVGLTSSLNPSVFGQSVTLTASVSVTAPGAGSASGTVNFLDGGNPIAACQNVALAAGQAVCMTTALTAGNHTITAQYSGDGSFNTSTGSLTGNPQVVNKANTTVGLTSSQNPAPLGTNITLTASLSVTAPGAGTPSGTVSFLDGGNPIAGCTAQTVTGGQATCQTTALTVGNHTITAQYSGDGNFNTSNGSLIGNPQVITGPPTLLPTVGLARMQGTAGSNSQIATVSDDVASPGSITVTAMTVPTGITIGNIINNAGNITADIAAGCNAATGNNTIVLKATDGKALETTVNLVVNVLANAQPSLGNYANSTIVLDCKLVLVPDAAPADNGSVTNVTATGSAGFTGTISVDAATGVVTINNNGPVNTHTITVTATDDCGATFQRMFTVQVVAPPTSPNEYDFDGDKKADVAVYRPGATVNDFSFWFILRSSDNSVQSIQFGHDADRIVPGDYDGDGDTDVAVFRPSINTWFTSQDPATNYGAVQWGVAGDIPVPGFYDADAKTDIAVWRPSDGNWYIVKSTGGTEVRGWGLNGDKPVPADYDGDGKTDVAVWRPSVSRWFIQKSTGGTIVENWGVSTDILVPADYDGDNKADMAVFRPSTGFWYVLQSTNGGMRAEKWGETGDVPVAADYDNDGKADLSVYRPSEGAWYIFSSCPCVLKGSSFGLATDRPVPSAFTPPSGP